MLAMTSSEIEVKVRTLKADDKATWPMAVRDAMLVFAVTCLGTLMVKLQSGACTEWSDVIEFSNFGVPMISGLLMGAVSLIRHYNVVIPEKP